MDKNIWQNLSKGQQVAAAGGVTAVIASFLPWYVLNDDFLASASVKGTSFTLGWMGMVLLAAAAGLIVAPAFDKTVGNDKINGEQIAIVAAAIGSLFWLIRFVQVPGVFFGAMGRGFGLFVAVAAAAAVTAGVVMTMKEKGIAMPNADTFKALTNNDAAAATTPAAPQAPAANHNSGSIEF